MNAALLALYPVVRGVIYVSLLLLAGSQAAGTLCGRHWTDTELTQALHSRLGRLPPRLLVVLIAVILVRGALQLVSFLDPGDVITVDLVKSGLLSGGWGHAWMLQLGAAALALAFLAYRGDRVAAPDWITTVLVAGMLWAQTGMGHAAGDNWHGPIGRLLDFAHLAGVSIWLGTLAVLLLTALPLVYVGTRLPALAVVVRAFSVYARVGVILVVLSGLTAALVYTRASIGLIPGSTWGRLLLIKLAGMLGVLALGWYNWRIVTPGLEALDGAASRRLRRAIAVELALGLVMLAITAFLVVAPLPGES